MSSANGLASSLLGIVACPTCRGRLLAGDDHLTCAVCGDQFPVVGGVPILLTGDASTSPPPRAPLPDDLLSRLAGLDGRWLHIGAGATATVIENRVELETNLAAHTSVVGDLNHLPFVSGQFQAVVALSILEHLPDPASAAKEMHRVLVPGGSVHVSMSFLQPEDASNPTYFRASERGLREWFSEFDELEITASDLSSTLHGRRSDGSD